MWSITISLKYFHNLERRNSQYPRNVNLFVLEVLQHDQSVPVYQQKMILERVLSIVCHCMVVAFHIFIFSGTTLPISTLSSDNDHIYSIKWPHPFWNRDLNNGKITNISKRKFLSKTNVHIIDFCTRNFRVKRFLFKPAWARSSNENFWSKFHIYIFFLRTMWQFLTIFNTFYP